MLNRNEDASLFSDGMDARQGQFAEAEARFRQQLAILRDLGNRERLSWSLSRLGAAVLAQGQLGDAATLLAEALAIAERYADPRGISRAHKELGYLALRQRAPDTARRHWRTAIEVAWRVQNRPQLLVTLEELMGLATLMGQAGDAERAVEVLALVRSAAHIDRRTETQAKQVLAEAEGLAAFRQASEGLTRCHDPDMRAALILTLAWCAAFHRALGQRDAERQALDRAETLLAEAVKPDDTHGAKSPSDAPVRPFRSQ